MTMPQYSILIAALAVSCAAALPAQAENDAKMSETVIRALLEIGEKTFVAGNQNCNLGQAYLESVNPGEEKPVKIKEPLIAQLAEMSAGDANKITASCQKDMRTTECRLNLYHAQDEVVSSTEYRLALVNGKAKADSVKCVSTP